MTEDEQMMYDNAALGEEVEDFMKSLVGQFIIKRIGEEIEIAQAGLEVVDPDDPNEIRRLQNMILVVKSVYSWLSEAVIAGAQSRQILEERGE